MGTNLGTAYGRIIIDGSGAARGFAQAQRGAVGFSRSAKVGFASLAVVAAGFATAMVSAVRTAASFEQVMSDLKSVARPTGQEFDALREQALKLGADTKFSASEAAAAQVELAKGGLSAADILGGALPGALSLAAAGDLELADAATISVNAMKQFGLAGKDVERIADAMAVAANQTTADVGDFGAAMTQGAAMAQQAGWGFDDAMAALSALADAGVKGSDAGTSMKTALQQLINPTAKQAKEARRLGISWLDNNGNMKDAAGISRELVKATTGMTKAERAKTFAILAGSDGFRTLSALYAAAPAGIRRYIREQARAGAAAEVAATKQDNLMGAWEELTGTIETGAIRVGSVAIPMLRDLAEETSAFLESAIDSDGFDSFAQNLADGFETGISALQSGWGIAQPLLIQVGQVGADAFDALGNAADGAAPVVMVLGEALVVTAGAALSVVGPVVSLTATLAGMPGVAQAAAAGITGLGVAFVSFRGINAAAGIAESAAGFVRLVASLRAVPPATNVAIASTRALAAQSAATSVATMRANMISAASHASYVKAFTGGNTTAARSAVTAAQAQIQAQTRVAMISAASARTFSRTFTPAAAGAAASSSKLGAVMGALAARFPLTAAGLGALATPAGVAALAIGGTAAAVAVLASGMFSGASTAERLAESLNRVADAATNADSALKTMRGAVESMKDAEVRHKTAAAALAAAEENLARVRNDPKASPAQIAQAEAGVTAARRELTKSTRELTSSQDGVKRTTANAIVQLARLTTETNRQKNVTKEQWETYNLVARQMGLNNTEATKFANTQGQLARQGASNEQRWSAIRKQLGGLVKTWDTSTDAGKRSKAQMEQWLQLNDRGFMKVSERIQQLQRDGMGRGEAIRTALDEALKDRTLRLDADDKASPKVKKAGQNADRAAKPRRAEIDADDKLSPKAKAAARALLGVKDRTATLTVQDNATLTITRVIGLLASVVSKTVTLTVQGNYPKGSPRFYEAAEMLAGMKDRTVTATVNVRGSAAMESMVLAFDRILAAREDLDAQLTRIDQREEARQARVERARLVREQRSAARKLANAKASEKAAAKSAANQATAALREFDRQARLEARRRPLQLKLDRIQVAESAMSDLESAMSDVGSRIGQALDDALSAAVAGIDTQLQGTLAYIDAHLRATLDMIERSAEAQRVRAIDAALDTARAARDQRDAGRRRSDLQAGLGTAEGELADAAARSARLRGILDAARTASERQAAQKLLDEAVAAEAEKRKALEAARLELADFEEDQRWAALEREKAALEASLTQQRENAEQVAQIAREAAEAKAAQERAAAEALYGERKARTERELGDLREQLRAGEISHAQFTQRLAAIYGDPTIAKALADSGQRLGLDFARGLDRSRAQVEKSAKALAAIVKKYMPQSPAEKGPLAYDQRLPGMAIAEGLASGMAALTPHVEAMARQLAEAAAMTIPASIWSDVAVATRPMSPAAWAGGRAVTHNNQRTINQTVNQQVAGPEDARETVRRLEWLAMTAGGRFT